MKPVVIEPTIGSDAAPCRPHQPFCHVVYLPRIAPAPQWRRHGRCFRSGRPGSPSSAIGARPVDGFVVPSQNMAPSLLGLGQIRVRPRERLKQPSLPPAFGREQTTDRLSVTGFGQSPTHPRPIDLGLAVVNFQYRLA